MRSCLALSLMLVFPVSLDLTAQETNVDPQHAANMRAGMTIFKQSVRTTLETNCLKCHNPKSMKGDFDLSNREALVNSGYLGESSDDSHLLQLVRHEEKPHMPHKADKLSDERVAQLSKWIELGAPYDKPLQDVTSLAAHKKVTDQDRAFWSFVPLQRPAVPSVDDDDWCRTAIDRFVYSRLQQRKLKPNPQADRRTLIRRAYFDLIGLPPSPTEVEQFVADETPSAYEQMIDRLLDSRHYGERWARHWLDVVRFAESSGFEHDDDRPNAYHYRDFVIKAFNDDLPFDEFIRWQLAGDELEPNNPVAMAATGFLTAGPFPTQLTEVEFEPARYDELDDMVTNTGLAFLGLSVGCARCHDHKFDPIPSRDYYRMAATFVKAVRSEVDLVLEPASPATKVQVTAVGFPPMKNHADGRGYPYFYESVHFLTRGDLSQKEDVVEHGFVQVLMRNESESQDWLVNPPDNWTRSEFRRAALANWITDAEVGAGHLAARVIVNRLWQHHFGRGIVATPNDFGMQGDRPTHPELLDYLANELIDGGWRLKRIHELIMTSSVYLQSDDQDEQRTNLDRDNTHYWRHTPRRLEAEAIRDATLSVAGLLDRTMFGPGTLDQSMKRRSIYFTIKRSKLIPSMMLFDWPEHLVSIARRATTTTAPQALLFMNSQQGREFAEGYASRISKLVTDGEEGKRVLEPAIERAYLLAYGRKSTQRELELARNFVQKQQSLYEESSSKAAESRALADFCHALLSSNEFVYIR